ncbi:TPA: alpha/beta hydrolase [Klebsiella pneumoniae]|uniref:alpha/beta hydrolase n=1 Tax=Klebsiella pneumoniae TaxID=573 RepID=UPI000D6EB40A|nr:alpha/beta hydrolase [Klebsiella pneumoniae]HDT4054581.1 alpha/beta hydrolase [Klebsiella pneumoniae subsp. pneumoniae]MBC4367654.1 alpha/beta hydrolase [Klebsiella pneumoniae]MCB3281137.1 alpha/beta hydrolase [Klebsiella pneumoniae]HBQ3113341.1 alpha/beta hydrolase [Klebsiella pneumoniae]HBR1653457.1 alpha/beta hydrolase [Klebsiella pneumoniae]
MRYGKETGNQYDFLSCGIPHAPTYVFIHGGYWSSGSKEEHAFIADGPIAKNMNVVLAEYSLAPGASMTQIVAEIRMLIEHLAADRDKLGIVDRQIYLGGHSAGGHLAAMYRSHPAVAGVHMLSGIADLEPIGLCWLQNKLELSSSEISNYSPLLHISKGAPTLISVGGEELPEFMRQSAMYAEVCKNNGEHISHILVPGADHFGILNDLADPEGRQLKAFMSLL